MSVTEKHCCAVCYLQWEGPHPGAKYCGDCHREALALRARVAALEDAGEMLWTVVANASGGDWSKQSPEWQEAAARWRDNYFAALKPTAPAQPEGQ